MKGAHSITGRDWTRIAIVAVATIGVWQVASGTYIHAKAWLAQQLIASAWTRTLEGEREVKPWPWADTWPIARLQAIDKDVDLYVLADASGRSLAFGPGHVNGTAAIGEGHTMLAGHRDTHFAFLRNLRPGEEFAIQTVDGREWRFQLSQTYVIDSRRERLQFDETGDATITLLTCYPFDAMTPGGPLRYVAVAGIKSFPGSLDVHSPSRHSPPNRRVAVPSRHPPGRNLLWLRAVFPAGGSSASDAELPERLISAGSDG